MKKKTLSPQWNESFVFDGDIFEQPTIILTMYDQDRFGSEFLGQVEVSLVSLSDGNAWSEWHELLSKKGAREAKGRGEIEIILQWKGGEQAKNDADDSDEEEPVETSKTPFGGLAEVVMLEDELDEIEEKEKVTSS